MKNRAKATDSWTPGCAARVHVAHQAALQGRWFWEAFSPIRISDPEKFQVLLGIPEKLHQVSKAYMDRLHAHPLIKDLERMCSGGDLLWKEAYQNIIVNTGLDDVLDKYFKGSAYTASHFIGLTDGTPTVAAGDTMASHAGWAEVVAYTEGTRQAYTPGTVASQAVSNTAAKAAFSINAASTTIGGGFLTTNSTKSGTAGTLVSAGAYGGGDRTLGSGDTLSVQTDYAIADT